ncbi:MAG: hypothetical protein JWR19_2632 [Pedosphaera sp.]|nr:hypothetical protein [Pedosphaera sp.]
MKKLLYVCLLLVTFGLFCQSVANAQTNVPSVVTDQSDYAPGSTATISGSGFQAGEVVQLQVLRTDIPDPDGPEHQPWQVTADENGNFEATWYVTPDEAGASLELTATGLTSGLVAQADFTDTINLTAASGGTAISADTAATGGSGAWTTLGAITLGEAANADFSAGTNVTLILKAPSGFQFNTASTPSISFTATKDITAASVVVTDSSTLTITVTVTNTTHLDSLVIGSTGLQVRPTQAGPLFTGNHIYRPTTGGGTETITGVTTSTDGSSGSIFGNLTEVAGNFVKLQLLMPGETNAPGTVSGKTGTPTAQTAGTSFAVIVNAVDTNWNVVSSTHTVSLSSTDPNDTLPANTPLVGGTKSLNVTNKTAGVWTFTATDITDGTKTANTGTATTVNAGTATKLVIQTQPSTTATAGTAFAQQPVILIEDANNNVISNSTVTVTAARLGGSGTLQGTTAVAAVGGVATFTDLSHLLASATPITIQFAAAGLTSVTSSSITVSAGAYSQLQVLLPGETAAPGTTTGKTGTPTGLTTDSSLTVTVKSVDANWNVVSTSDTVAITSSDVNATLPANAALLAGTKTFTVNLNTVGNWAVTATDVSNANNGTSAAVAVSVGAFAKLQLLMPGETAAPGSATGKTGTPTAQTAGTAFNVVVNGVDAHWNIVLGLNGHNFTMHLVSSDPGFPADDQDLSSSTTTFTETFVTAGSQTLTVSDSDDGSKTPNTSPATTVNPGAAAQLVILTAPSSTATAGTAFAQQPVILIEDANNNVRSNDTLVVTATRHTGTPGLQGTTSVAAVNSKVTFTNLSMNAAGTITIDFTSSGLTTATSGNVAVSAGTFTQLQLLMPGETNAPGTVSGKTGSPTAQAAGTSFAVVVNAVDTNWNVVSSTHTVGITSTDPNETLPANTPLVAGTKSLNVTNKTAGVWTFTATDITDGTKTANTGSATTVNAGTANKLVIQTQPSTTATAGIAFTQQPVILIEDANNNVRSNDTLTVTATRSGGSGTLQGTTAIAAVNGVATFTNLSHLLASATPITIQFTSGALTSATSSGITVSAGAYSQLQVLLPGESAAPATGTGKTGTPTAQNTDTATSVIVNAVDANWNVVSSVDSVAITSSDVNATLPANAALVAGTKTFSVNFNTVGSRTVTATDVSNNNTGTSAAVTVNAGAFVKLQLLMPGETAAPGTATGKTGTPTAQTASTQFTVTVNAVDANWNLASSGHTIVITSSDSNATLPPNAGLAAGTKNFNVTFNTAGSRTVTATDSTDGTKTASTSPATTVNVGAFAKLQLLVPGETTAPGTASGKTGTPTAETAGTAFNVTVNAVDANWNLISTNDTVAITSSDANATLPTNAALIGGTQTFSISLKAAGGRTITASDTTHGTMTANTSPSITVNAGTFIKLQLLMPGETAAPGTATGKTGTPTVQTAGTTFALIVNAVDTNWNVVSSTHTVGITSSDATATLPLNTPLVAGTKSLSVTNKTAGTQTFTATDITDSTKTANTGTPTTVSAATFTKLQLLVPGETAVPGSATGKTGTPTTEISNVVFSVTVNAVDANWNLINTNDTIKIISTDASAVLPANAALVSGTKNFSVTLKTPGSSTITASNVTHTAITFSASPSITVSGQQNQTITFGPLSGKVYGDATFGVSATASSGLSVAFSILSGPATISGTNISITGVGSVIIRALQAGNASFIAATNDQSFTVAQAALNVAVDYKSRLTTETNPVLTGTITGIKNSDNITATYSTTATYGCPLGNYTITATLVDPNSKLGNYTVTGLTNTLSVNTVPIEWPVASGGNGHFYQPILAPNGIIWGDAEAAAVAKGGYLVTITSSNENTFVFNMITNHLDYWNLSLGPIELLGPWIGGIQPPGSVEPAGGWSWITGEPFVYTNWGPGQPNDDVPGDQNRIQIFSLSGHPDSVWNDLHDTDASLVSSYIIEYDTDPSKTNQTITFGSLATKTYGNAPFTVSATASSGLAVTFSIVSGPATVSGNTITLTGAGSVTVRAAQAGNSNFNAAGNVDQSFTVNPASLTVVAANATRVYGVANPALTGTLTGVQSGDNITATFATIATPASSVDTYAITPSLVDPNNRLSNYTVNSTNGTLTITRATPTITWANPADIVYGTALSGTQLNASSPVAGVFTYVPVSGTILNASNAQILSVSFVPTDTVNYSNASTTALVNVLKASLTVTVNDTNRVYGAANPTFTGTVSGVQNSDGISANYTTPATATSPVGTYAITATLVDTNSKVGNYLVNITDGVLTITAATPSITWTNPADIVYGTTLSGTELNAVGSVPGTLNYTPASGSILNAGIQTLSVTLTPTDTNYVNASTTVQVNVLASGSTNAVSTSANPALPGATVTFTSTLEAIAPGSGTPTGSVQFKINGTAVGAPVVVTNGVAAFSTAALAHGLHNVTAEYVGDGNFTGSTNSVSPQQMINTPPVTHIFSFSTTQDTAKGFSSSKLLQTVSDADHDTITMTSLDATSVNGGTVVLSGGVITYTPPAGSTNTDSFTYNVSDGFGGSSIGTVVVNVIASTASAPAQNVTGFNMLPNGNASIHFAGIPGRTYTIQASTDLHTWTNVGSAPASANGAFQFEDLDTASFPSRYYRSAFP